VPYKEEKESVEKVRANFSVLDLYKCMMAPQAHMQLEDIHVYNGRPRWEERFASVSSTHQDEDIGVTFCGNPLIGKDLALMCYKFSGARQKGIFKLHKENF